MHLGIPLNVNMDGVVQEANARVFVKVLQLLHVDSDRLKINQLCADDTALVADEKLCKLVSEFGRV